MTTSRTPVPQVNLKDRIAALQQKSNTTNHGSGTSSTLAPGGSLRDKIANFERKGAVPTPRGRFGTGAPPVEDGSTKKKGELYGNRVPELAKPSPEAVLATRRRTISATSDSLHPSRPTSPCADPSNTEPPVPPIPTALAYVGRRVASDVLPRRQSSMDTNEEDSTSSSKDTHANDKDMIPPGVVSISASLEQKPTKKADVTGADLTQTSIISLPIPQVRLSVNTDNDGSSSSDDATASSYSVPTPSDNSSFHISESPKDANAKYAHNALSREQSLSLVKERPSVSPRVVTKVTVVSRSTENYSPSKMSSVKAPTEVETAPLTGAEQPASPADIRVEPPTTGQTPAPASSGSPPSPLSPSAIPVERKAPPTFNVVVHRKVRESVMPESAPPMPAPSRVPLVQAPKAPVINRVKTTAVSEPQSPGLGDLASLVFNAALLEEHLSGAPAPVKEPAAPAQPLPAPAVKIEPAVVEELILDKVEPVPEPAPEPELIEPQSSELPYDVPELPPVTEDEVLKSPIAEPAFRRMSMIAPTPRVVTSSDTQPQDTSSRHFSLRTRKGSVPGAHPRNSICSEMSEESSVFVSRPTSPPGTSDTSSVRSSSKSWKSPKKGIGRASSWLFRGKSKNPVVVAEEDTGSSDVPPSPSLLSPYSPLNGRSQTLSRPSSWVSVSSAGSGDVFDSDLVNSFPSVPGGAHAYSASHLRSQTLPPAAPNLSQQPAQRSHTVGHVSGRQQQRLL